MKRFLCLLLCILLCACSPEGELSARLDAVFAQTNEKRQIRRNNYSSYLEYYLPSDVNELQSSDITSILMYNGSRLIMDINIAGIINEKYYPETGLSDEGFFDPERLVYAKEGTYLSYEGQENEYLYRVYEYEDDYLAYFLSRGLIFYGFASREDIVELSSRIYLIARSSTVSKDNVIAVYSSKDVIDYEKKQVDLFETIMPVNGNINDFMIEKTEEEDTGE